MGDDKRMPQIMWVPPKPQFVITYFDEAQPTDKQGVDDSQVCAGLRVNMDPKKRKPEDVSRPAKRSRLISPELPSGPTKVILTDEVPSRPLPKPRKKALQRNRQPVQHTVTETQPVQPRENLQASSVRSQFCDKLHRAIINGCLWHKECRRMVEEELPSEVPLSFESVDEYIRIYEPLLEEEARESTRGNWAEACEAGNWWTCSMTRTDIVGSGCARVDLTLLNHATGRKEGPNAKSVVILTNFMPPKRNAGDYLAGLLNGKGSEKGDRQGRHRYGPEEASGKGEPGGVGIVAGVVGPVNKDCPLRLSLDLFSVCPRHESTADAPCGKVLKLLQSKDESWYLIPVGPIVTHAREYDALQSVYKLDFLKALLKPEQELAMPVDKLPRKWPSEVGKGLHEAMSKEYDGPQSDAVAMCTAHFAARPKVVREQGSGNSQKGHPIMLIQGPPGTGKTHTVRGVLNLWHLVQFQRYYEKVIGRFKQDHGEEVVSGTGEQWAELMTIMKTGEMRVDMKPRILVCAPSNTATDELLERILKQGFFDASGRQYFPNVVRVGAEARVGVDGVPVSEGARAVWVEELVKTWLDMDRDEWMRRMFRCESEIKALSKEISNLEQVMRHDPQTINKHAGSLIAKMEKREKCEIEMERLECVGSNVSGGHPGIIRDAREKLELTYMNHAEMVFTTLSSTGKHVFSKVSKGFKTVLIDEAAQANEVATLQPLMHGCRHCVMVGDPQQLPATVLSQKAKELNMERSLFDRLQRAGAPVKVLTIQYRMHPQIRQFPSAYFYNNSLQDGQNIKNDKFHEFYSHSLLKPYVLFDVSMGQHERQNSGSLQNQMEADMAAALFRELRDWLIKRMGDLKTEGKPPLRSVRVGVITPYKSQRNCIKETFKRILGKKVADEVKITTVDSFQGKQCDVVILSCVRASSRSSGVGFVADIRRMNVAITRAKRALWILGNVRTLKSNPAWSFLIDDAEKRGCVIRNAFARELFPHQPQFQSLSRQTDESTTGPRFESIGEKSGSSRVEIRQKPRGRGSHLRHARQKGIRGQTHPGQTDQRVESLSPHVTDEEMPHDPRRGVIKQSNSVHNPGLSTSAKHLQIPNSPSPNTRYNLLQGAMTSSAAAVTAPGHHQLTVSTPGMASIHQPVRGGMQSGLDGAATVWENTDVIMQEAMVYVGNVAKAPDHLQGKANKATQHMDPRLQPHVVLADGQIPMMNQHQMAFPSNHALPRTVIRHQVPYMRPIELHQSQVRPVKPMIHPAEHPQTGVSHMVQRQVPRGSLGPALTGQQQRPRNVNRGWKPPNFVKHKRMRRK